MLGAGAYIVGEETAMLESIEGVRNAKNQASFPAVKGLYGKPTIINNTETLASVPKIMLKDNNWYKNLGEGDSEGKNLCMISHK